jgi:hydrogenase expression/formation protein HypD
MEYIDAYRNPDRIEHLVTQIRRISRKPIKLMEVCGTHTVAIARNGLKEILPDHITLVSGPGCPVCVTPIGAIDQAIALSQKSGVCLATFGDMLRVPGSRTSLLRQRAEGVDIRVVYSAYDGLQMARENSNRQVVFLGTGFETTAPTVAAVIRRAREDGIDNFTVLSTHKVLPPALKALVQSPDLEIDGFICPGHVTTIIGTEPYLSIARDFHVPCVVAGFEPVDVLQAITLLVQQKEAGEARVEIQYRRAVSPQGNPKARALLGEVFEPCDSIWRGFGLLPESGLEIAASYGHFDAKRRFDVTPIDVQEPKGCICGDILRGLRQPSDCALFQKVCTPEDPVGACMVSSEGTCAAYYKYRKDSGIRVPWNPGQQAFDYRRGIGHDIPEQT